MTTTAIDDPKAPAWNPASFDPHDPAFLADPYPTYAQFRALAPVAWVKEYQAWWVFRYADVKTVLDGTETYLKNPVDPPPSQPIPLFHVLGYMPEGLFFMDPPEHTKVRGILNPLFAKAIADGGAISTALAGPLLVAAKQQQRFDLVSTYALPLPAQVLLTIMGIPQEDWTGLIGWTTAIVAGHDITQPISVRAAAGTCNMAMGAYYQALQKGCPLDKKQPRLLDLMVLQATKQGMTIEEVQETAINFNVAGYLSTTFLIATGTYNLLQNPSQLALLRQKPNLIPNAVEEMLRYDTPAQVVDRVAAQDVVLGGVKIQKGDTVTAVLGSANHDETVFPNPETFDVTRDASKHVAFGDGIHYCIGAPLARLVTPAAITTLLQQLPSFSLAGIPQWQTDPYLRSVSNLPIAVG
jgi:unspecific monooxygenase